MEENKNVNETLKKIYDSLTDEQKEKIKACKTDEEVIKFAGEEGIELPDEILDNVAGGVVVDIKDGTWSAFDNDGKYLGNKWGKEAAQELAKQNGASTAETDYNGLQRIRYEAEQRKKSC